MKKISKMKKIEVKTSPVHYVTGVVFVAIIAIILYLTLSPKTERILLEKGTIEKTSLVTSYVIKHESVIEKDIDKILIPVISEGSKAQKGAIIATYKGEEYKNYEETLARMDKEILELMQDLPPVYSSEVDAIDNIIYSLVKETINETSYAKMQEYKQRINTQMKKRASIIGKLSPDGANVKTLIEERNKYEENGKKSNDNILAPITGLISYKTDGLEDKLTVNNIEKLTYNDIKNYVDEYKNTTSTNIKIANNYEAYIVSKVPQEALTYLKNNTSYTLRLIESNNLEIKGQLVKFIECDDGIEIYFRVTNNIEELIDLRNIELEIVWWKANGLVVTNDALVKENDVDYIYAIKYSEIVKIPVKISKQNDKYSVIMDYTSEELEQLGIETDYKIKLYDRIIIKNKK